MNGTGKRAKVGKPSQKVLKKKKKCPKGETMLWKRMRVPWYGPSDEYV